MWQDDKAPTLLQTVFVFDEWIKNFKWFTVLPRRLYQSRGSRGHPAFYRRRSHAAQSFPVCSFHQAVFFSYHFCWFLGSDFWTFFPICVTCIDCAICSLSGSSYVMSRLSRRAPNVCQVQWDLIFLYRPCSHTADLLQKFHSFHSSDGGCVQLCSDEWTVSIKSATCEYTLKGSDLYRTEALCSSGVDIVEIFLLLGGGAERIIK